ncbi:glutamate--cysteine ligase [Microvirga sp. W0021]|uniref:Glutamate--cysteine ligase n=1 Tax=Hohaiivirga grylli TaxID=3133970 RepID=A0ABV0BHB4_9HYPH
MARDVSDSTPVCSKADLINWIAEGEKPSSDWRVGTEHEKVPFYQADFSPVPYEGENGIRSLLEQLAKTKPWEEITEFGKIIGLFDETGGDAVSLEPGGQFELSGAPLANIHQTKAELDKHLADTKKIGEKLGIRFLTLGTSPKWSRAETPVMPKGRYKIMTNYMPKVGQHGLDMMYRTATVQANLDYSSEQDMVKKMRVSIALQPIATALFANSPFMDGKPNGYLSMRSEIWKDTDNNRAGMTPFVFEEGFGYERYVDWVLDVPMYFIKRGDTYHDVAGQSFKDLLAGNLPGHADEKATMSDWANHVSTVFPEVRLKRYIEMRGADVGSPEFILALPALWIGLLYDSDVLDAAWDLVKDWTADERQQLRDDVPSIALKAKIGSRSVQDIAKDVLDLAGRGLARRGIKNADGQDESHYLNPLRTIAESGKTSAELLLERYNGVWNGNLDNAFKEYVF